MPTPEGKVLVCHRSPTNLVAWLPSPSPAGRSRDPLPLRHPMAPERVRLPTEVPPGLSGSGGSIAAGRLAVRWPRARRTLSRGPKATEQPRPHHTVFTFVSMKDFKRSTSAPRSAGSVPSLCINHRPTTVDALPRPRRQPAWSCRSIISRRLRRPRLDVLTPVRSQSGRRPRRAGEKVRRRRLRRQVYDLWRLSPRSTAWRTTC